MQHKIEIADSKGKTMQLSVTANTLGYGGSWRALDKGMIKHNSGPIEQSNHASTGFYLDAYLEAGGHWGIRLDEFISWGTVNDEGTGVVEQAWVIGLEPGAIEWSLV